MVFIDTVTNLNITIEHDIYSTTTSACSGGFMNYEKGTLSGSATNYKFKDDWYSVESWNKKAKNKFICEIWDDNNSTGSYSDISTRWIKEFTNATTDAYGHWTHWNYDDGTPARILTPQEKLREILQRRQAPIVIASHKTVTPTSDFREMRARETLKRVLGDDKFKSFLKRGFISVRAKSGLVYQIFPGHDMTTVYRDGEMIERLCVILRGNFPDTDSIIMRYLLILNDEKDFRKHAIQHTIIQKKVAPVVDDQKTLPEIWRGLKVA